MEESKPQETHNEQAQQTPSQPVQPQQHAQHEHKPEEHKHHDHEKKPGFLSKLKDKLLNYRRVIEVSRKPDKEEFINASKITGAGMLIIGFIGFMIFIIYQLVV